MPFKLEREKTGSTPYILIEEQEGYMKLEGVSFHENVIGFFKEISDWLNDFLETDFNSFTFDCALEYFNSSTAKLLLNILFNLDEYASADKKITINWITSSDNDIIIECGEDFQEEMSNLTFNLIIK